ncbi:hypothetical protein P4V41_14475 [Fictibacillus nanhaiensis]|uniref:hypothetical protein n=1 Tax=Fictibacillus nanhaiensis TaxID=742169 RepID=UPI002E1C3AFB|nr:hypothetical protein [Fictibacillus nanhaiensis]
MYKLFIQKQEGRGSEVFEERSVVLLHEHRENKTDEEIRRLSMFKLFIQKQEGRGSEVFEERSVVLLHEHRKNKTDEEIRRLSMNKEKTGCWI